jgi:hypothetical protein
MGAQSTRVVRDDRVPYRDAPDRLSGGGVLPGKGRLCDEPSAKAAAAPRDYAEKVGTEQKTIQVDNILQQARQNEADAAYLRKSASDALLAGDISAGSDVLGGLSPLLKGLGGGSLGRGGMGLPSGAATGGLY